MKRYLFILVALAFAALSGPAESATCFWVGGTGNINDTTKWSSSSGGAGSTCAAAGGWPNSTADSATFDGSSGGGTVTRNANWTIATLNMSAFTSGTLGNSTDTATVNLLTLTNNGSATRTLNLGASTWTCGVTATNACTWSITGATNLTLNANTSTVVFSGSTTSAQQTANLGAFTYNVVTFKPDGGTFGTVWNSSGTVNFGTLNIGAPNYYSMTNSNIVVPTTLNFTGGSPSITSLTSFVSSSFGNQFQITPGNSPTCNYCVFRDTRINTNTITGTNSLDLGRNTGVSITPPTVGGGGGRIIGG